MQLAEAIAKITVLEGRGKKELIEEAVKSLKAEPPTPQLVSTVKDLIQTEV